MLGPILDSQFQGTATRDQGDSEQYARNIGEVERATTTLEPLHSAFDFVLVFGGLRRP